MQTYSFHFHTVTVQCKALIRIKVQCAKSYIGFTTVNALSITEQFSFQCIEVGIIQVPAVRFSYFQCEGFFGDTFFPVGNASTALCYLLARSIV